jgi:hypothetical protein
MRRVIRCKIHLDSSDWEQTVSHPDSCSKMNHLRSESVPIFWGCEGSGLEPWRARSRKDDTQLTGPATPHRIITQLGKCLRWSLRYDHFPLGAKFPFPSRDELDLDMSLTLNVELTPSVANMYEYPGASIYSNLCLRCVCSSTMSTRMLVAETLGGPFFRYDRDQ